MEDLRGERSGLDEEVVAHVRVLQALPLPRHVDRRVDDEISEGHRIDVERSFLPVLRRDIHVADTDFEALESVRPILKEGYRGVGLDRLLVGSPHTVLRRLAEYREMGFGHVLVRHITGDHGPMLDSFGLIGRHVVPEISGWD